MMCLPCLPSCSSCTDAAASTSGRLDGLKRKVSPYCALIPSVFSLATCVMSLVMVLIYHNHYLTIPFAASIACSFYLVYVSYQSRLLDSLQKNVRGLEAVNSGLTSNLATAQAHAGELRLQADRHQQANAEQERLISELRTEKVALMADLTHLQQGAKDQLASLASLAEGDAEKQKRLQVILGLFEDQRVQYEAHNKAHGDANAEQQNALKAEMDSFRGLIATQKSLFTALQHLVEGDVAFKAIFDRLGLVQGQQAEVQKQVGVAAASVHAATSKLTDLEKRIAEREARLMQIENRLASLMAEHEATLQRETAAFAASNSALRTSALIVAGAAQALSPLRPAGAQVEGIPATAPVPVFVYQPGEETGAAGSLPAATATPVKQTATT